MNLRDAFNEKHICSIMRDIPDEICIDFAEAVYRGGISMFEIAMNSNGGTGDRQIALLRKHFSDRPEVLIGAGTVISYERCSRAEAAGATFFLTPSVSEVTLRYCSDRDIALLPGVATPTDVAICLSYGYDVLKLFPAGDMPMGYVKSLRGPFDGTDYVAVGGVGPKNIADFLSHGFIGAGIGSSLVPKELIKEHRWEDISSSVRSMMAGIN